MAGEHRPGTVGERLSTPGHPALASQLPLPARLILVAALLLTALFGLLLPALLPSSASAAATPVRALVTVSPSKVYDGSATGTAVTACTIATPDTTTPIADVNCNSVSATTTFSAGAAVGDNKTITVTGLTASGAGCDATDGCSITQITKADGSTPITANITKKSILPSVAASNKEYDGTASAAATCSLTFSPTGNNPLTAVTGDNVTCGPTSASFIAGAAVGNNKTVSVTGLTLGGTAAGNYELSQTTGSTTANITTKALTPTITAASKTYDGNANVTGTPTCTFASGVVGSEVVTCSIGSISFANKNVGTNKTVTASGLTLGGANAANYSLSTTTATTTANITAKTLTPTLATPNKTYDGNTTATGTTCTFTAGQVISGDVVTCTVGTATFANKNVGTAKAVSISGLALTGTDSGNYALSSTTGSATANITAKALTATLTTPNKVYDGTTAAPGTTCTFSSGQVISGDTVNCTVGGATFANKNAGTAKAVNVTGLALTGADATNYSLPATGSTTANITPKPATVTSSTVASRQYDGTLQAAIDSCALTGLIAGDTVTCSGTGQFADPDVGLAKPVTVNSIVLGGPDGANYSTQAPYPATTGAITPKLVSATIETPNKVFNGSAAAPGTACTVTPGQILPADVVSCVVGAASFNSASVGNDKPVTATALSLEGPDSPNYAVDPPTATTTASILPVPEVRIKREVFKRGRATFYFASQVRPNQAEYRCSLNDRAFRPCSSPEAYSGLKAGRKYTFRVRATLLGETGPTTRVTWRQAR